MSFPSKKTVFLILLFLLPVIASATYATYRHSAFVVADGKDIDLNGQSIGNGSIIQLAEEYSNHLGMNDSFMSTETDGSNGIVATNVSYHEMNISSGLGNGFAAFRTNSTWILGDKPIVVNFLIDKMVNGSGDNLRNYIGLRGDFSNNDDINDAEFYQAGNNIWWTKTSDHFLGVTNTQITGPITNGTLLSIVATKTVVNFYSNGTLLSSHTTNVPVLPMHIGASIVSSGAVTEPRFYAVDFFSMKRYT
jgi:hypothetical protein